MSDVYRKDLGNGAELVGMKVPTTPENQVKMLRALFQGLTMCQGCLLAAEAMISMNSVEAPALSNDQLKAQCLKVGAELDVLGLAIRDTLRAAQEFEEATKAATGTAGGLN